MRDNNILPLPSKTTITKYLKSSNTGCGFDENFFSLFKEQILTYPELARNGTLSFDEMQVRSAVDVNVQSMTFDGLLDFNCKNSTSDTLSDNNLDKKADKALVFMYSSLAHKFQQPVGMFASMGNTTSKELALLITTGIMAVEKAGAKVHALVCDGASVNRGIWSEFGIKGRVDEPVCSSFTNPFDESRQIYIISDVPHLLKCIRNNLYNRKEFMVKM